MELVLTAVAALTAVVLLLRVMDARVRVLALLVLWVVAAGAAAWMGRKAPAGSAADPITGARPVAVRDRGYVSSNSCRTCHPSQYASWHDSYHRTMTQVLTPKTMIADWDGTTLEVYGKRYSFTRVADEYWVEIAEGARREKHRVVLATGSHHQQVFWIPSGNGRELRLLGTTWLIPEQQWIPYQNSFLRPDHLMPQNEIWNVQCIKCHSTAGRPGRDEKTRDLDTTVAEFGIACEACHGPAEEHVRRNRDPLRRYALHLGGGRDESIVHPNKLSAKLSSQICGQCHSVSAFRSQVDIDRWWKDGFSYRPGKDLDETREIVRRPTDPNHPDLLDPTTRKGFDQICWPDGAIRVSGREYNGHIESPCYRGGQFSCQSCHSMHESDPNDQLASNRTGDEACLQCHQDYAGDIEAHTHHPVSSSGSRCYNCHMPHTSYGLFKAIRAHRIGSPSVKESLMVGRPNACNLCHLDKTLDWTRLSLERWYATPQEPIPDGKWKERSAALLWLLEGDAGQRALIAWGLGWEPALEASGRHWIAPFLAYELADSYAAVRFIAARSLKGLPGYDGFPYEFVAPRPQRFQAMQAALGIWARGPRSARRESELFLRPNGSLDRQAVAKTILGRDQRAVNLAE